MIDSEIPHGYCGAITDFDCTRRFGWIKLYFKLIGQHDNSAGNSFTFGNELFSNKSTKSKFIDKYGDVMNVKNMMGLLYISTWITQNFKSFSGTYNPLFEIPPKDKIKYVKK